MRDAELDELLRAVSHRERRRLLADCLGRARSAGELSDGSTLSIASVSEHLKVLRKTGLLVLEKEGRHWFYRTDEQRFARVAEALRHTLASNRKG